MRHKKASRHKKLARRSRQRRHARRLGRVTSNTTVYSAAAWWRDNDPSMQVAALDPKVAEKMIHKMMKDEAKSAYDEESAYDDAKYDSVDDAMDRIAWSGVHAFAVKDLTSERDRAEAIEELTNNGYFYPETP
jgi:hypothetical protein